LGQERQSVIREEYVRMKESGEAPTFFKNLWHYPAQTILPGVKKKVVVPSLYLISLFNNVFQDRPARLVAFRASALNPVIIELGYLIC
jgi:hypothetical protein